MNLKAVAEYLQSMDAGQLGVNLFIGLLFFLFFGLKLNNVIHATSFLATDHHEQTALVRAVRRQNVFFVAFGYQIAANGIGN